MKSPVVVFAIGNPGRGDDAIGPELGARLEAAGLPGVEVITDFQLQIEHALDLEDRRLAIFVDAALDAEPPCELRPVRPQRDGSHTSHALSPAAVLDTFQRCFNDAPPPSWVLAVRGEEFELGAALSEPARANLEAAWAVLRELPANPALKRPLPAA